MNGNFPSNFMLIISSYNLCVEAGILPTTISVQLLQVWERDNALFGVERYLARTPTSRTLGGDSSSPAHFAAKLH